MTVEIVTPKGVLLKKDNVKELAAPGICGDFGVWKNHVSFVTALREGAVSITDDEQKKTMLNIKDGIFEVLNNKILVLTESGEIKE